MRTVVRGRSAGIAVVVAALLLLATNASARTVATEASSASAAMTSISRMNEFKNVAGKHGVSVPRIGISKIDPNVIRELEASEAVIAIYLVTPDYLFVYRPAYNTTCTSQSSGIVYNPTSVSTLLPYAQFSSIPEGVYDCAVDQPGYYRFTETINTTTTASVRFFHLVPISYGVTIIYNFLGSSSGTGGVFYPNMTFPAGAFKFRFATAMDVSQTGDNRASDYNYGLSGKLPARYHWSLWFSELQAATSGVYHYSVETAHFSLPPGLPPGFEIPALPDFGFNFLNGSGSVSIFAGYNQKTGFYGSFFPKRVDAQSWHVGSLSVTNPREGCSRYSWHTVDTYSKTYGVNPNSPASGSGDLIMEECFDVSDAALRCSAKVFDEDVDTLTCGAFGDPHIVMFNGTGVTCGNDAAIVLVDNQWFSLVGVTTLVANNPASTIRSVTFTYKGSCNPATVTFNDLGLITQAQLPNSPISMRHRVRLSGNNIYVDAIRLRVQVRAVEDSSGLPTLIFGVSMPTALVGNSTGVCAQSCPAGTLVSIDAGTRKRDPARMAMAEAACDDAGLTGSSFERQACLFDVETTGDINYASAASTSRAVKSDVGSSWANDDLGAASTLATLTFSALFAALAILSVL